MAEDAYRFDRFRLEPENRRLLAGETPVELNGRYLDALILLVGERGGLVSKDRFMAEVWRGVPVTDEALTQCIRSLRRLLGDDAARPRFIETVPKHGYRFIAPVLTGAEAPPARVATRERPAAWEMLFRSGQAGLLGGGAAGLIGGLVYGGLGISDGGGGASALVVLACLTLIVGMLGGAGVGFGIGAAGFAPGRRGMWTVLGGGVGGLVVGTLVKLIGLDAFDLLFGRSPGDITGGPEGLMLGLAIGLAAWIAQAGAASPRRAALIGGGLTGLAGLGVALAGGRLMGGSLALLAETFPQSRLRIAPLEALVGEASLGPISQMTTAALEGGLFGACVLAALTLSRRASPGRTGRGDET